MGLSCTKIASQKDSFDKASKSAQAELFGYRFCLPRMGLSCTKIASQKDSFDKASKSAQAELFGYRF
jgi:hypothetical protein